MAYKNPAPTSSYQNKDFQKIFPQMLDLVKKLTYKWDPSISNESDPGVILTKLNAIVCDKNNYNIDKAELEYFPETVAQQQNAYSMLRQLGYYPKWYISATMDLIFKFKGDSEGKSTVTIPRFTMFCDDSKSLVYTTIEKDVTIDLNSNEFSDPVGSIQGSINDYTLNGDSLIRFSDLDSKRRLYFDEMNIAQNGIFIYNDGDDGNFWTQTDNLYAEELKSIPEGSTTNYYSFGLSRDLGRCYVEFAEDAEECIGGGIRIKYITSDGFDGNAPARTIDRLFENGNFNTDVEGEPISLSEENLIVRNDSSSTNGKNSESIDEMYKGYQRTVGTFNTLVTIRDYINYIVGTGLVSNGFVCDRLDDIQSSYKVVTLDNDVNIIKSGVLDDEMNAFDLRMYLNKVNTSPLTSIDSFHQTFEYVPSASTVQSDIITKMEDEDKCKCVLHDFKDILGTTYNRSTQEVTQKGRVRFCGFLCKYNIDCKVVPQYDITTTQRNEISDNIRNGLYANFNAFKLQYGVKSEYDEVYRTILESDERIKSVYLNDFDYTVYAILWNDNSKKFEEYVVSDDLAYEVIARSILAGITQGYFKDKKYTYNLNMCINKNKNDISTISSVADIGWDSSEVSTGVFNYSYSISNPNENIVFYAPQKQEVVEYSTYTKYECTLSGTVAENTEHVLGIGESIRFSWKENSSTRWANYSEGTTIKPSFNLSNTSGQESLGSTNSVSILDKNEVNIPTGTKCYWILNSRTVSDDTYTLFKEGTTNPEYMLNSGEYFVYTNTDNTQIEFLGAGTKLKYNGEVTSDWSVKAIDSEALLEDGTSADVEWFTIPSGSVDATEMRVVTLGSGCEVHINNSSAMANWSGNDFNTIDGNAIISYSIDGGEEQYLESISGCSSDQWVGVSRLNIKMSPTQGQELAPNHKIILEPGNPSNYISGADSKFVKSNVYIDSPGSNYIDIRSYNLGDGCYSNSSMIGFNESTPSITPNQSSIPPVAGSKVDNYENGYIVTLPYQSSNTSYIVAVDNRLTQGNYAFAVSGSNFDINISNVSVTRGGSNTTVLSESNTSKYFSFNVPSDEATNKSTVITITRETSESFKSDEFVYIRPLFKYTDGNINSNVSEVMQAIDSNNEFDYGYEVDLDTEVENPVDPISFFDANHIYNKFTLPYINNISIKITNVKV